MKHVLAIVLVILAFGVFAFLCDVACTMGVINPGYECGFILDRLK